MSDWIKSSVDLSDHPKTHILCSSLNERVPYVIGTLHMLWHFAMRFAWRDGDLTRFGVVAIARACHTQLDPQVFVSRLQEAGFLDGLKIHDWHEFAGRLVQDRLRYHKANKTRTKHERKPSVVRTEHVAKSSVEESRVDKSSEEKSTTTGRTPFSKPSADQVSLYAKEIGFILDGQKFIDHYESKGWVVGKSPMKNWQACVRTWKSNGYGGQNGTGAKTSSNVRLSQSDPERVKAYD